MKVGELLLELLLKNFSRCRQKGDGPKILELYCIGVRFLQDRQDISPFPGGWVGTRYQGGVPDSVQLQTEQRGQ